MYTYYKDQFILDDEEDEEDFLTDDVFNEYISYDITDDGYCYDDEDDDNEYWYGDEEIGE